MRLPLRIDDQHRRLALGLAAPLGIAGVALALRLLLVLFGADPEPAPFSDSDYYHRVARSLAEGGGFSYLHGSSAFWPPGYPFFLAILYAIATPSVKLALVANAVLGAATVLLTYLAGARLWGRACGLIASSIMAVLPSHIFWSAVLLSEILFSFTFIAGFWLALESVRERDGRPTVRWLPLVAFAALFACGVVIRGQMAVLLPVAALFWWRSGVPLARACAFLALPVVATTIIVVPWSIRNARVFDEPIVLSSNVGYNVRIGHNPDAFGRFDFIDDFWPEGTTPGDLTPEREVAFNRDGLRDGVRYAATHPARELWLSVQKVYWLYRADVDSWIWIESFFLTPLPSVELRFAIIRSVSASYYLLLLTAAAGAPLTLGRRDPRRLALAATILLWTLFHVLFFSETRFHVPLLPLMAIMAARAFQWLLAHRDELRTAGRVAMHPTLA